MNKKLIFILTIIHLNIFCTSAQIYPVRPQLSDKNSFSMILLPDPQSYNKFDANQPLFELQTAWIAREIDSDENVILAMQPTRGLDVGAIENIHKNLLRQRDAGKAVLLVSFDLEEVMNISDRIIVFYEGEIVADVRPEEVTVNELGLYMSGSKRKGAVK